MADKPKEIVPGETIEESLEWIEEMAKGYQAQYGGCAACVVQAVQKKFNLPGGQLGVKACNYAGLGIARMGDMCGALFGAIVCLGLASGRENLKDPAYPEMNVLDERTGNPKSLETLAQMQKLIVGRDILGIRAVTWP